MKRLIMHIGTPKTGTTALQFFMLDNLDALQDQGFCYLPTAKYYPHINIGRNGHFLYCYACDAMDTKEYFKQFTARNNKNMELFLKTAFQEDNVIMSDEGFWYQASVFPECIPVWKIAFDEAGFDQVDIYVYLRRQDKFITSLWNQRVKSLHLLCSSLNSFSKRDTSIKIMDYSATLKAIESAFGQNQIHVNIYERDQLVERDIRRDFCSKVGIEISDEFVFNEIKPNLSLSRNAAEIKRISNGVEAYRDGANFLARAAAGVTQTARSDAAPPSLSNERRNEILEAYAAGNERIAREHLHREDGVLFDSPTPIDPKMGPVQHDPYIDDVIRYFTAALAEEHKRVRELEKQVDSLTKVPNIFEFFRMR